MKKKVLPATAATLFEELCNCCANVGGGRGDGGDGFGRCDGDHGATLAAT